MPNYDKRVLSYSSSYFQAPIGEVTPEESRFWINGAKRAKAMSSFSKRFVVMNIMHSTKFVKWSLIRRLDGKVSKHVSRGWSSEGDI